MSSPVIEGIDRPTAEWVLQQIRRHNGEVVRQVNTKVVALESDANAYPQAYPAVPVEFLGSYTDDFLTTAGLSDAFVSSMTSPVKAADGYLSLTATASGTPAYVYCGRTGGAFLPHDGDWTVTVKVTQCGTLYNKAGVGIDDQTFVDGINWAASGHCSLCLRYQTAALFRIYAMDSTSDYADISALPSRSNPLYLKVEYTASTGTLVYKYREGDAGGFTTIATHVVGTSYFTSGIDCGPWAGSTGTTDVDVELGSIEVSYTPTDAGDVFAFIPTRSFGGYAVDHLYIRKPDGTLEDIDPSGDVIDDAHLLVFSQGALYYWDGSDWTLARVPPSLHAPRHEDGGADEISVTGLSGLLADAQTPLTHASTHENGGSDEVDVTDLSGLLADPQDASIPGGTEDRIVTLDSDASIKEGSKTIAELLTETTDLQAKILALLATLNHNRIPGIVHGIHKNLDVDTTLQIPETAANDAPTLDSRELQLWIDSDDSNRAILVIKSSDTGATYGAEVTNLAT